MPLSVAPRRTRAALRPVVVLAPVMMLALSSCGVMDRFRRPATEAAPPIATDLATEIAPPVETQSLETLGQGQSASALDQTSEADKTAALTAAPAMGEKELGRVVVSLGSPGEPGLWLRTTLVDQPARGRVATAGGQTLALDLLPGTGGSQLSLAAFQALGLNLTSLPEVTVLGP